MSRRSAVAAMKFGGRNRRVVEMYYAEGLSQAEIAKRLDMGQQNVSKILRRPEAIAYADELLEAATNDALKIVKMASVKAARREVAALDHKDVYANLQASRDLLDRAGIKDKDAAAIKVELLGGADIDMIGEAEDAESAAELPANG